jgi:DNA repair protein RadA/Sms
VGVFEMREGGMVEVANPSAAFLEERVEHGTGSAVVVTMEGTRPLLVEVQALASKSALAMPRRSATGIDFNRLMLLSAVLTRRLGAALWDQDLYVNVVGGLRIQEPAADVGVALALLSSFRDRPVDPAMVAIGEVGLAGELRSVGQTEARLREAAKLGFERALVPRGAARHLKGLGIELLPAGNLKEAASLGLQERGA